MRDFLPADVRKRNYVINIIKEVYESYGFEPLETPAVENIETLTGKYGEEGNQLVFKILKRGEKLDLKTATKESDLSDLALRYDLTVPLARVVANNRNELPKFFKRYQIQPVWRADRPAHGRFREFYQCDVDCIGSESILVEAEQISAVTDTLGRLGFDDFEIRLNHRSVLYGILGHTFPNNRLDEAIVILDKFDKIGIDGVRSELLASDFDAHAVSDFVDSYLVRLRDYFNAESSDYSSDVNRNRAWNRVILSLHDSKFATNQLAKTANDNLRHLVDLLEQSDGVSNILIDTTLARGISYYTGAIFEVVLKRKDFRGSIGGGGRYDGLIGMFGKEQIPACGFSLGLERILVVMEERGMFPAEIAESAPADVMVTIGSEETIADSLRLASELRATGLRVTVYPQADKEDKQWKYANSIGVPWLCTVNEIDIAEKAVSFQDLRSRERYREPLETAAARMRGE